MRYKSGSYFCPWVSEIVDRSIKYSCEVDVLSYLRHCSLCTAQVGRVNVFYDKDKETKLVVWDKPLGEVTVYSVRISYNDGSSGQRINQYRSSKNQWLELGLINLPTQRPLWIEVLILILHEKRSRVSMCTYFVQVRARGSAGAAPWSSRVELCVDEQKG